MSAPSQALDPKLIAPPVAPEADVAPETHAAPQPDTPPQPDTAPETSPRTSANRLNAQLSTGPRTAAGKLRSSLNALRHGLTSHTDLLPSEDPAAYQAHRRSFFQDLQPLGALEQQLVHSLASTAWRLNRIPALEAALLAPTPADALVKQTRALAALSAHEARLSRQFDRTLKQLREIQAERRAAEATQVEVQEVAIADGPNAGKLGFVLRNNPVDAYLARHARQETQFPPHPARPLARTAAAGPATS